MHPLILDNLEAIRALCREYGVVRLDVIGSAAGGRFVPEASDVDFVVTFANTHVPGYADRYFGLAEALEALLHRPVDLIVERAIRNPYFRAEVEASRQLIFDETHASTAA